MPNKYDELRATSTARILALRIAAEETLILMLSKMPAAIQNKLNLCTDIQTKINHVIEFQQQLATQYESDLISNHEITSTADPKQLNELLIHICVIDLLVGLSKTEHIDPKTCVELIDKLSATVPNFYELLNYADKTTKEIYAQLLVETEYTSTKRTIDTLLISSKDIEAKQSATNTDEQTYINIKREDQISAQVDTFIDNFQQPSITATVTSRTNTIKTNRQLQAQANQKQKTQAALDDLEKTQIIKSKESFSEAWLAVQCQLMLQDPTHSTLIKLTSDGLFQLTAAGISRARAVLGFVVQEAEDNENIITPDLVLLTLYLGRKNVEGHAERYGLIGDGSREKPFSGDNLRALLIGCTAKLSATTLSFIPQELHEEIENLCETVKDYCANERIALGRGERLLFDFGNRAQNPTSANADINTKDRKEKLINLVKRIKKYIASIKRYLRAQGDESIKSAPDRYGQFFLAQGNVGAYLAATAFLNAATHLRATNKAYDNYLDDLACVIAERIDYLEQKKIVADQTDPVKVIMERLQDCGNYKDFCRMYRCFAPKIALPFESDAIALYYAERNANNIADAQKIDNYNKVEAIIKAKVNEIDDLSRASYMTHTLAYKDTYNSPSHVYPLKDHKFRNIMCHAQGVVKDEMGLGVTFFTPKDSKNFPPNTDPDSEDTVPLFITLPGTHDQASALRDFDPISAGFAAWCGNSKYRARVADALNAAIKKLRLEFPDKKISIEIFGHSLGGADALQMELLILEAMTQNANEGQFKQQLAMFDAAKDQKLGKRLSDGLKAARGIQPRHFGPFENDNRRFPVEELSIKNICSENIARIATYTDRGAGEHPAQNASTCACMAFFARLGVKIHSRTMDVEGDMLAWFVPLTGPYYIDPKENFFADKNVKKNLDLMFVETKTGIGPKKWGWLVNAATRNKLSILAAHTTQYLQQVSKYSQKHHFVRGNIAENRENDRYKNAMSQSRIRLLLRTNGKFLVNWDILSGYLVRVSRWFWQNTVLIIRIILEAVKHILDPIFNAGDNKAYDTPPQGLANIVQQKKAKTKNLIIQFNAYAKQDPDKRFVKAATLATEKLGKGTENNLNFIKLLQEKLNEILNEAVNSFPDLIDEYESKLNYWVLFCEQNGLNNFNAETYRDAVFTAFKNNNLVEVDLALNKIIHDLDVAEVDKDPSLPSHEFLLSIQALQQHIQLVLAIRGALANEQGLQAAEAQNLIKTLIDHQVIKKPSFESQDTAKAKTQNLLNDLRRLDITNKHTTHLFFKTLLAVDICLQAEYATKPGRDFNSYLIQKDKLQASESKIQDIAKNKRKIHKAIKLYNELIANYDTDIKVRVSSNWQFQQLQQLRNSGYLVETNAPVLPKDFELSAKGLFYARNLINIAISEPENNMQLTEQDLAIIAQFFGLGLFREMLIRYGLLGNASKDYPFTLDNLRAVLIGIATNNKEKDLYWLSETHANMVQAQIRKIRAHVRIPAAHLGTSKRMVTDFYYREQNALPAGKDLPGRIYRRLIRWLSRSVPLVFQNAALVAGQYYVALGFFGAGQLTSIIPPNNIGAYNFAKDVERLYSEESVTSLVREDDIAIPGPIRADTLLKQPDIEVSDQKKRKDDGMAQKATNDLKTSAKYTAEELNAKLLQVLTIAKLATSYDEFCFYYPYFHRANFENDSEIFVDYFNNKSSAAASEAITNLIKLHLDNCDEELLVAPNISDKRRNAALAEMLQTAATVNTYAEFCHIYPMFNLENTNYSESNELQFYFKTKKYRDNIYNIKALFINKLIHIDQLARAEIMAHDLSNLSESAVPKERGIRFLDHNLNERRFILEHVKDKNRDQHNDNRVNTDKYTGLRRLELKIFKPIKNSEELAQPEMSGEPIPLMIAIPEIVNEIVLFDFMRPFVHSAVQYRRGRQGLTGNSTQQKAIQQNLITAIDAAIKETKQQFPDRKIRLEIFGHSTAGSQALQLEALILEHLYKNTDPYSSISANNIASLYTYSDRGVGETKAAAMRRAELSTKIAKLKGIKLHHVSVDREGDATKYLAADDADRYINRDDQFVKENIISEHIMGRTNKGKRHHGWWTNRMAKGQMTSWYVHRERQFQGPERYHSSFEMISTATDGDISRFTHRLNKKLGMAKGYWQQNLLLRGIMAEATLTLSYGLIRSATTLCHARIWHWLTRIPLETFYHYVLSSEHDVPHAGLKRTSMGDLTPYFQKCLVAYKNHSANTYPSLQKPSTPLNSISNLDSPYSSYKSIQSAIPNPGLVSDPINPQVKNFFSPRNGFLKK